MTNNERLLMPRYLVIADYPSYTGNYFKHHKGEIIVFDNDRYVLLWKELNGDGTMCHESHFEKYPSIFRKLHWWEHRKPEELPEYVKDEHGEVWRVEEYSGNSYVSLYKNFHDYHFPMGGHSLYELLPATLEEYTEYQSLKTK